MKKYNDYFEKRIFKNKPNKSHEINGKRVWESRSVAVNAVIIIEYNDELYVLMAQRGEGAADNQFKWNVPSGYLDNNETGPEAADREVWEETGFDITTINKIKSDDVVANFLEQPWFVNTDPSANRQNVSLRYGVFFRTKKLPMLTDIFSEPKEIADLKWEKIENIDKYDWAYGHDKVIGQFIQLLVDNGYIE